MPENQLKSDIISLQIHQGNDVTFPKKHPENKRTILHTEQVNIQRLLVQCLSNVNSASNCTTYHRVIADSEEAHHLHVGRN